nr:reverse transcriptase domain-containing protein [Tanacetum cinerariifolium]
MAKSANLSPQKPPQVTDTRMWLGSHTESAIIAMAVSIEYLEEAAYLCLHFTKDHKGTRSIRRAASGLRPYHFTYLERRTSSGKSRQTSNEVLNKDQPQTTNKLVIQTSSEEQTPSIPFPQRLRKEKEEAPQRKFLENLKQLHINLPFIKALAQMPKYAKFLKGLLTNKARLEEACTITMNERCSTVLLNKLPSKEKDPGSFTIPCDISQLHTDNALADLGASISLMSYMMYEKLGLGEPKATRISLELADRSIQYPRGIIKNVLIKVDKFVLPIYFVILDTPEDSAVPIILERPFLATARAMIDGLRKSIDQSDLESCESLENKSNNESDLGIPIRRINSVNMPYSVEHRTARPDEVKSEHLYLASANKIDEKRPELKSLPNHLEYAFLQGYKSFPIIISSKLFEKEKKLLLQVLENVKEQLLGKKKAENLAVDHLSRLENPDFGTFTKDAIANEFPDEHLMILKAELSDDEPWYVDYVNYIIGKIVPPNWTPEKRRRFFSQVENYFWDEPYAFELCPDNVMRRCFAGSKILKILAHYHSGPTGGHHNASITRRKGLEFMGPFPNSKGNKYILIVVDYVSKWVKAQALPKNDAHVVIKFLRKLFAWFGVPKALISDRETHFYNSQLEKALQKYGVTHKLSTAYHPQTDRQTEVTNRAIKRILERSVGYNLKNWFEKLNDALWAFRTAYKTPTGCTPFRLVYGKACHRLVEIEHRAYWELKQCNMDLIATAKNHFMELNELMELRDGAYKTSASTRRTKKWHDFRLRWDKN